MSGMTLVFVPPWITVGAKVVCVHAWNCRAMPIGSASHSSTNAVSSSSGAASSSG